MKESEKYDKLARRLGMILTRLNTGEKLHLEELAVEFNVSTRTLQRDFNERLDYLPIERQGATYFLNPTVLGKQSGRELSVLLLNMGLDSLFSGKHYLSNGILNSQVTPPFLFKNPNIENISNNAQVFDKLVEAIQRKHVISFTYNDKTYSEFHPYRLVNDRGFWYLAGSHRERLDSLRVAYISQFIRHEDKYIPHRNIEKQLTEHPVDNELPCIIEVIVNVHRNAVDTILNEESLHPFVLLKELESGDALLSYKTNNTSSLIRYLKSWVPDVEVLSPDWFRYQLMQELQSYLDSTK